MKYMLMMMGERTYEKEWYDADDEYNDDDDDDDRDDAGCTELHLRYQHRNLWYIIDSIY